MQISPGQRGDARLVLALIGALPPPQRLIADAAYDSNGLRQFLRERGTQPVIKPNPTRKRPLSLDRTAYRRRNAIERFFARIKDFRRIATRYDKLATNYLAAICLVATLCYWL